MKLRNKIGYALPPVLTMAILCTVYLVKHIYPFGINTIDFYDLSNQIVTYYCHVYDVLHGDKNLFYDMYTALGTSMAGTCGSSNINIFNLFFLFVKRESILPLMSVFLMIKMMAMSLSMYIFLKNTSKAKYIYKLIFSVGYAFSGFLLTTYTIMEWQDVAAFFPLIMLGLYKLIKGESEKLYIIMLSMSLIAGYYISFLVLIFIFLLVGFSVLYSKIKKDNRIYSLTKLLFSTVISLAISAFIVIPQLLQTTGSARFGNESGSGLFDMYFGILKNVKPAYTSRWFILAGLTLPIVIIVYSIYKTKEKDYISYVIFAAFTLLSAFIIESINLIWHYGSYVHYPMRNGFIVSFCIYVLAGIGLEKIGVVEEEEGTNTNNILNVKNVIVAVISAILATTIIFVYKGLAELTLRNIFHIFVAFMAVCICAYICLFVCADIKKRCVFTAIIVCLFICETIIYGYVFLGKPAYTTGYTEEPEMESDYYYVCNELGNTILADEIANPFVRFKNPDESLNSNYGLVLKAPSLSNWTALISPELQNTAKNLGYSIQYTRLLDSGGTVFSDALMGIKYIISVNELDENLYTLKDTVIVNSKFMTNGERKYYLYESKFSLPFGIKISNPYIDFENNDIVDIYNDIYMTLGGEPSDDGYRFMEDVTFGMIAEDEEKAVYFDDIEVSGKKVLYYIANQVDEDDYNTAITVNGQEVLIPSVMETDNTLYPAHFNNNAVCLGVFEDETVSFEAAFSKEKPSGDLVESEFVPRVLSLDLTMMENFISNYDDIVTSRSACKTGYDFTASLDDDSIANEEDGICAYLMIPASYDRGFSTKCNGKNVETFSLGGMFMAVPLFKGENCISIRYIPYGMIPGIIVSIISLIILVIVSVLNNKISTDKVDMALGNIYALSYITVMIVMYIIPYVYGALSIIGIV